MVNLGQVAKLIDNPTQKGIIMNLLRVTPALEFMSFQDVSALQNVTVRWVNLPDVNFRRINEDYTTDEGDFEQVYESVYAFGGGIEIDRVFDKIGASMIANPLTENMLMFTKSMATKFGDTLINGDHAVDVDAFEGLKKRIANGPSRQKIRASATTDILDPTASSTNARLFLKKWEEGYQYAGEGRPNVILTNLSLKLGLGEVLRYLAIQGGSVLSVTQDIWGKPFYSYNGVPLIDMGLLLNQSTEIIPNNETADDGGADSTSAYFVPFNMEQGISGIQLDAIEVFDGLPTKSISKKQIIEWWVGIAGFGSYGPTRVYNIETPASWT